MSNKAEIPLKLRRRTHLVDRVIKNLLSNIYPCYYNSSDHFVAGVLDEIIWFLLDMKELQGIDRNDIENYILDYKYDELTDYFNEHCIVLKNDNLQEHIRKVLRETLESKWNKGNYNYQHGYCHYFAYNIIGKIKKMFPNKKVNYYMILANEVDTTDGTIVQDYLIHVYIQIDNMLLDSNGITTHDKAWERAEEWEQRQAHLVPEYYETKMWEEESDTIPEYFFNSQFCNVGRVKKDLEDFLSNPIVKRILRDK
jgi:hypothetical protein